MVPRTSHKWTFFERCLATLVNPIDRKTGSKIPSSGAVNSTKSNPHRPIGFSNKSLMYLPLTISIGNYICNEQQGGTSLRDTFNRSKKVAKFMKGEKLY